MPATARCGDREGPERCLEVARVTPGRDEHERQTDEDETDECECLGHGGNHLTDLATGFTRRLCYSCGSAYV